MSNMTRRGFLGFLGKALAVGAVGAVAPEILKSSESLPVESAPRRLVAVGVPGVQGVPPEVGVTGPQGPVGISCPNAVGVTGCTGSTGSTGVSGTESCLECRNLRREIEKRGEPLTWRCHRILTEHELDRVIFPYGPEPD